MKPPILFATLAGLIVVGVAVGLLAWSRTHAGFDPSVAVPAYYLPSGERCTVLFDFAEQRAQLDGMDAQARAVYLAQRMIRDFQASAGKAGAARTVELKAVYILGKDNYHRPDFSKRMDLVKLSGTHEQFQQLSESALEDWPALQQAIGVEIAP